MKKAVLIDPRDDVVTLTEAAEAGDSVCYILNGQEQVVTARSAVPAFHKIAIEDRRAGESLHKYAQAIGLASQDIRRGDHVDTHNLRSVRA